MIETYNPETLDTLGRRIAHIREKLSNWCANALLAKASKELKKRISLCCDKPKMPIMIGCDSQYYYGKIKWKYKKWKQYKKNSSKEEKLDIIKENVIKRLINPHIEKER